MTVKKTTCDSERLAKLLSDELSELEEARATDHISSCETCRSALQELAAGREWWREASDLLSGGEWVDGTLTLTSQDFDQTASYRGQSTGPDSTVTSLDFLTPSDDPAILGRLGRYEILAAIGAGGFGIVLKGFDAELNRYVAVKVLAPHLANNAAARKRFAREAQAAAAVVHPHVVAIHAIEAAGPLPYLVMPLIAGESLQDRLDRCGPLETKEILRIALQIAQGLAAAHSQGVVHRDVKPANILLEPGVDRVLLTDFGLARVIDDASLTRSMVIAGTPQYMSPEQAQGNPVDHRTDLFSLGSVMYAMCTGHPPFRAETLMGILRRISDGTPRSVREINPDVPTWLASIIARLHANQPDERISSAAELAELLEQYLAHIQQPSRAPLPRIPGASPTLNVLKDARKRRSIAAAVSGALVLIAIVAAAIWFSGAEPRGGANSADRTIQPDRSQAQRDQTNAGGSQVVDPPPAWFDDTEAMFQEIETGLRNLEVTFDPEFESQ